MKLRGPYQERSIRFKEVTNYEGWRIKVYGISRQNQDPIDDGLFATSTGRLFNHLPSNATSESSYGVGFYILHQGEHRNWFLLDWWHDQEILKQKLFSSPLEDPEKIAEAEPDLMACTWEMAIQCFERQAWIEQVLKNPDGPDLTAYLAEQMNADV